MSLHRFDVFCLSGGKKDFYELRCNPRGECVVINNEKFPGTMLRNRPGTQQDEGTCLLLVLFDDLVLTVCVCSHVQCRDNGSILRDPFYMHAGPLTVLYYPAPVTLSLYYHTVNPLIVVCIPLKAGLL